jgi:pimeloyl-ACP methyl ester carboxylesterase
VVRPLVLLALLLPLAAPRVVHAADEGAHRRVFSAAAIPAPGGLPTASLAIGFTQHYRGAVPHAAFAFAQGEDARAAWALSSGHASPADAEREAMASCERQLRQMRRPLNAPCRLLASDGRILGGPSIAAEQGSLGPFTRSAFHLHRGPSAADGVVVWGHGYGGTREDMRGAPLPGFLTGLNEAGYDILRFDRVPGDDALYVTLPRLVRALPLLRQAGYRRVILGGQSRGGWQAMLAAAERPELVDAVLAAAPAAHGEVGASAEAKAQALEDFRRVLAGLRATPMRLLVMLFEDDEFDPDPDQRAQAVAAWAATREAPALALWPQGPARGHSAVGDWRFTRDYAACVLTLLRAPDPGAPRGLRRRSCGGG